MNIRKILTIASFPAWLLLACNADQTTEKEKTTDAMTAWKIHDMNRPRPQVVQPLPQVLPAPAPANAIMLFDGTNLDGWTNEKGEPAKWVIENGYMVETPGAGSIQTKQTLGDVYLHVEWASPYPAKDTGQDRGNSGIFLMQQFELQVLDSYQADTYADGQAGALYGQVPPRFNVCKPPGEWQAYDIFFRRPRFAKDSSLASPAFITVLHNGILIQDNESYKGPTSWLKYLPYKDRGDALPLLLQDHGSPVRFRNIWAVPLPDYAIPSADYGDKTISLSTNELEKFVGVYDRPGQDAPITITLEGGKLFGDFYWRPGALELVPTAKNEFVLKETDGIVRFESDEQNQVTGLIFDVGRVDMPAKKRK